MRRKMKEMLNKEEGFTLVELLAVIVILGIILAIAIPSVGSVIDRADADAEEAENALVEDAARLYVTTNENEENKPVWEEDTATIPVETLISEGYLEDRNTDGDSLDGEVTVEKEGNKYTYSYNGATTGTDENTTEGGL